MKKKVILSILMLVSLAISLQPAIYGDAGDTLVWHSSLVTGTKIAWRMTDYSYATDSFSIAGNYLDVGDTIIYELVDTPQTIADDVYDDGPEFVKLCIWGDKYIPWHEVTESDVNVLLPRIIMPLEYHFANGTILDLEQTIYYIATFDAAIYSVTMNYDGDFLVVDYDTSYALIEVKYNSQTGITESFYIDAPYGDAWFELCIWDSTIDSYGTTINNTLVWHNSLTAGVSIAWQLVDLNSDEDHLVFGEDEYGYEYGKIWVGDDLIFHLTSNIPTDPLEVYGIEDPPSFLELSVNDEPLPWDVLDEGVGIVISWLISPIQVNIYNGTFLGLEDFINLRAAMEGDTIADMSYTISGDYMDLWFYFSWWQWDEGANQDVQVNMTVTYTINMQTGITKQVVFEDPDSGDYGVFVLDIWTSSIDDYGTVIDNNLTWFSGLTPVNWLSWQITSVDITDPEMQFELGGYNLAENTFIRLKITDNIPTDPLEIYGDEPPNFIVPYVNNDPINWDDINGVAGYFFRFLVLPLSLDLYNGTSFDLIQLISLFGMMDNDFNVTSLTTYPDKIHFTIHIETEYWDNDDVNTEIADISYTMIRNTGISSQIFLSVPCGDNINQPSTMQLEFSVPYSSIDAFGNPNDDFTTSVPEVTSTSGGGTTNTMTIPGFGLIISSIGVTVAVFIKKRR
ncbi:MAG: hypothetical protein ACTSYN_01465 [Candidatus Heimdallarchaeaceae archaeon]